MNHSRREPGAHNKLSFAYMCFGSPRAFPLKLPAYEATHHQRQRGATNACRTALLPILSPSKTRWQQNDAPFNVPPYAGLLHSSWAAASGIHGTLPFFSRCMGSPSGESTGKLPAASSSGSASGCTYQLLTDCGRHCAALTSVSLGRKPMRRPAQTKSALCLPRQLQRLAAGNSHHG